jgi:hypothetical protein
MKNKEANGCNAIRHDGRVCVCLIFFLVLLDACKLQAKHNQNAPMQLDDAVSMCPCVCVVDIYL